ncbi:MAG: retron system putative HNH endonuclease [Ignavibacteria bacterium]|nr:retron system putative HNH endonuclease [Ignavibacteria bacterium]
MLNITSRISFSKDAKRRIKKFYKKNKGGLDSSSWANISKNVKNEISRKLFAKDGYKCIYCERYLIALSPEIDHFAHKAAYPQFTFTTVNFFYSCGFCNSTSRKGQKSTILSLHQYYNRCIFNIIHPYYDDPNNEIKFQDADRIKLDWDNCTIKGKATIDFFHYNDTIMTMIRSRDLGIDRLNPLLSSDERKLIQESIAYK